ncbi:hypothetical protein K474DRAFT_1583933, partial [Panus rudis PR-1116 ss-1]
LHLTQHKSFTVLAKKNRISFQRDRTVMLSATVTDDNVATLDGTIDYQAARVSQLDRTLLHRRLCHCSESRIDQLLKHKLMVNLKLGSDAPMSDLCEPCVMGKQHRFPFP